MSTKELEEELNKNLSEEHTEETSWWSRWKKRPEQSKVELPPEVYEALKAQHEV